MEDGVLYYILLQTILKKSIKSFGGAGFPLVFFENDRLSNSIQ